jgi:hypothetical protein
MNTWMKAVTLLAVAGSVSAQVPGAAAKAAAKSAVAATNAHTEAEQAVEQPKTPVKSAAKPAPAKTVAHKNLELEGASVDTTGTPAVIMRETYAYSRDGRRDPYVSLLTTNELRPTMSDLRLTGILYDEGGHSVATLRDIATNASYRVGAGSTLGRMRVSVIRLKTVVFTIDEFGTTRQDSLFLGDSTKVRGK